MPASLTPDLRRELETELRRLLETWCPRTLDREYGGFLCNCDHRWKSLGAHLKMLEHQGRQTLSAARGAIHFPDCAPAREAAAHGVRCLKDTMWDRDNGGWYRLLSRTGEPLEGATKHGHGSSYAISACVACYELFRDTECLDLAKSAFAWLEEHAHDDRHGGYFVFYRRDGTPILSADQTPEPGQRVDAIGTPIGCKDANTTSDLLKALADLSRVWPDGLVRRRLEELLHVQRDRMVVAPGVMHMFALPDWTPVPVSCVTGRSSVPRISCRRRRKPSQEPSIRRPSGSPPPWSRRCSASPGILRRADSTRPGQAWGRPISRTGSSSCGASSGGRRPMA